MDEVELAAVNKRIDELLTQAAQCTIPDADFDELFGLCLSLQRILPQEQYTLCAGRLETAVNSYCHILRVAGGLKDETVDLQTASRLVVRVNSREPLTDKEVRLLGKRGVDDEADGELFIAFLGLVTVKATRPDQPPAPGQAVPVVYKSLLPDEQLGILAQSVIEQVVVMPTIKVTDKGNFGRWAAKSPMLQTRFQLAYRIGLLTEHYMEVLPAPNFTQAQRKAEVDYIQDICCRAQLHDGLSRDECEFLLDHRPSSLALKRSMWRAFWLNMNNIVPVMRKRCSL